MPSQQPLTSLQFPTLTTILPRSASLSITILASAGVVHIHFVRRNRGVGEEPGGAPPPNLPLTLLSHVEIELESDRTDRATSEL
ncbi:E3 ubiquitin-protein ligase complex slx8-rfp subunit slx8 [Pyrus ussuriensis x Pyrus communis]|uniref:E3 ubiquitin-protein ligase complex slx8-rfp subunit slx8 n=1 Tax=Pyrus ussuriensis x Pyrus communis TaxID=2448454 RepID=A0A5N5FZY3_9ROSA|nr:E3 ubiquitin-protein ligase complex slx8-rfp subunit slx8 [Pyrus ussuriensis x Pyrus communis]